MSATHFKVRCCAALCTPVTGQTVSKLFGGGGGGGDLVESGQKPVKLLKIYILLVCE